MNLPTLSCGLVCVILVSITVDGSALWWQCNQLQWPCISGHLSVDTWLDVWCKIDALKLVEHLLQVLEIRPAIAWDKGKAVDFLLSSLGEYNSCRKHIRSEMLSASIFCNLWLVRVIAQKRNWFWYGGMTGLADSSKVFPVYIGDDRTDEDAFNVRGIYHMTIWPHLSWSACIFKWLFPCPQCICCGCLDLWSL